MQGSARKDVVCGAARVYTFTVPGPKWKSWLESIRVDSDTVLGGQTVRGTVRLNSPSGTSDIPVDLQSSVPSAASVQPNVTIPQGHTSASFSVSTSPVSRPTHITLSAFYRSLTVTTVLVIQPPTPTLESLIVLPRQTTSGVSVTGEVALRHPAPNSGVSVELGSSNLSAAEPPPFVIVEAGRTTAPFQIKVRQVFVDQTVRITARVENSSKSFDLPIQAARAELARLGVEPSPVRGGDVATAQLTLTAAAPPEGYGVQLSSSDSGAASVPSSVVVPGSRTVEEFAVQTYAVPSDRQVTLTARANGVVKTATLTVLAAPALQSVSVSPLAVTGGDSATGVVTLDGPAPVGGAVVNLQSDNSAAQVQASATVSAGQFSTTFEISTQSVASTQSVTITASYNNTTRTATLTVNPAIANLQSVSVSPLAVTGGDSATGVVTLDGPAGRRSGSEPAERQQCRPGSGKCDRVGGTILDNV